MALKTFLRAHGSDIPFEINHQCLGSSQRESCLLVYATPQLDADLNFDPSPMVKVYAMILAVAAVNRVVQVGGWEWEVAEAPRTSIEPRTSLCYYTLLAV
ncbi:hypothetical protein B566_EDAN015479 [Ephemera danica]|nr:hypothetical protein B566_EDAN015479 [Ephemera danica]